MQVTFKDVGRNKMTWVAEMRPPTEQKMLAAIAHRGALLSRNITLEHDISNDQKFAICAGARVVGLIYLGNALAVEQAREQSVESAQPLYPRKIQTQDDTENDRRLRAFSSSSTAQPQPEQLDMLAESSAALDQLEQQSLAADERAAVELRDADRVLEYYIDHTGSLASGNIEWMGQAIIIHPSDEQRIIAAFQAEGWRCELKDAALDNLDILIAKLLHT